MALSGIPNSGEMLTVRTRDAAGNEYTYDIHKFDSSIPLKNVVVTATDARLPIRYCNLSEEQIWVKGETFQLEYEVAGNAKTFTSEKIVSVALT